MYMRRDSRCDEQFQEDNDRHTVVSVETLAVFFDRCQLERLRVFSSM